MDQKLYFLESITKSTFSVKDKAKLLTLMFTEKNIVESTGTLINVSPGGYDIWRGIQAVYERVVARCVGAGEPEIKKLCIQQAKLIKYRNQLAFLRRADCNEAKDVATCNESKSEVLDKLAAKIRKQEEKIAKLRA